MWGSSLLRRIAGTATRTSALAGSQSGTDRRGAANGLYAPRPAHYSTGSAPCRIGCASGFWGDTPTAVNQLVKGGKLDYLILDYLSEITMSLLTAARAKDPNMGYCPDFVLSSVGPSLKALKKAGVKVVSNAGGINPEACAAALLKMAEKQGVHIKVGVVTGDSLLPVPPAIQAAADMQSGAPLPEGAKVMSCNAYTGAGPIIRALELGADIVVTGRTADSSLALAPAAFHHGWSLSSLEQTAGGSLAGHLIECGAQATGGNITDWRKVQGWSNMGFPIASVSSCGATLLSKPPNTGGLLAPLSVTEQMLYEVGDPRAYVLPDVVVDMTPVTVTQGSDGIEVQGAKGRPATDTYKVGATYLDGYKATAVCMIGGNGAAEKARITGEATVERVNRLLGAAGGACFPRVNVQVLGAEDTYGAHARGGDCREAVLWLSVQHADKRAVELFAREIAAAGTGGVPGLMGLVGGRPRPSPVLRLHSALIPKGEVKMRVRVGDHSEDYTEAPGPASYADYTAPHHPGVEEQGARTYKLSELAVARSGDKGDSCNIAVAARGPEAWPALRGLTAAAVARYMAHVFPEGVDPQACVQRYEVPGTHALNFVLSRSLGGGGVASLRADPQGKAYGQMLLDMPLQGPELDLSKLH